MTVSNTCGTDFTADIRNTSGTWKDDTVVCQTGTTISGALGKIVPGKYRYALVWAYASPFINCYGSCYLDIVNHLSEYGFVPGGTLSDSTSYAFPNAPGWANFGSTVLYCSEAGDPVCRSANRVAFVDFYCLQAIGLKRFVWSCP